MIEKYQKEFLEKKVKESHNYSDLTRSIGLKPHCGNRFTVKKYIKEYNIDISHFDFKADYSTRKKRDKKPLLNILQENTSVCTSSLKKRLYTEGLKLPICEICGQDELWRGKKMSLILDHINGNNNDNRIENLRIICPNCNATLDTYGGKNIKQKPKKTKYFCNCGNEITRKAKSCVKCSEINQRKSNRPSLKTLKEEIEKLGYKGTGRKYGVSDNAIRKWLKIMKKNS